MLNGELAGTIYVLMQHGTVGTGTARSKPRVVPILNDVIGCYNLIKDTEPRKNRKGR